MEALRKKAKELLSAGAVKVVIGYGAGSTPERVRAVFARTAEQADGLTMPVAQADSLSSSAQNLAVYLMKPEVKALGKVAVVVRTVGLRALLQFAVENQIAEDAAVALAVGDDGAVHELPTLAAVEEYVAQLPRGLAAAEKAELERIDQMSREERWAYWYAEMARCIKCYACRAACPMCYCSRCITDNNAPQWVPTTSDALGNLEWNIARAMHLAGRCVNCGSCAKACPQGIRIDLLNQVVAREALTEFGAEAGFSRRKDYALASFKPEDKEEFIR